MIKQNDDLLKKNYYTNANMGNKDFYLLQSVDVNIEKCLLVLDNIICNSLNFKLINIMTDVK